MLRTVFFIALAAAAAALAGLVSLLPTPTPPEAATGNATLAVLNARIFDGQALNAPQTIVVADAQIAAIGADLAVPPDARVLDAAGRAVIPGLIDAHVHSWGEAQREALRFGVTTSLDMFTSPLVLPEAQRARETLTPTNHADLFSAGMLATAAGGHGTQFGVPIETLSAPEEAPGWVARRLAEGSDYIKLVYMPAQSRLPSLDRATAAAVIAAAHAEGVLAVAHISSEEGARHMIEDGVDGLVHIFADIEASPALVSLAAQNDVFVIPTLTVIGGINERGFSAEFAADPRIAPHLTAAQRTGMARSFGLSSPAFNFARAVDNVRALHAGGVALLAGSDAPNPATAHGATVHQEMALLVQAGLTPAEALAAATVVPARHFALADRGRVAPGARADFLIIDGDPTTDISATRAIVHIVKNGAVVDRAGEAAANASGAPADLGDFDDGLTAPDGFAWSATDDSTFGGASAASIARVEPGANGSGGALQVRAEVRAGFFVPWAGASFTIASEDAAPASLEDYERLVFQARGEPGPYRVMAFDAATTGAPPTQVVQLTESWERFMIDLSEFAGLDRANFVGFAVVAGPEAGAVEFVLDEVRLE